ncbi:MAG TPA: DUF3857 domain-containing protein, partial [Fibrobacteria bacterium]|nr:DUF3857 domain-containing protein [Fibrobacteria bacterium]
MRPARIRRPACLPFCAAALLLAGCAAKPREWYREAVMAPPEVEAEWAKYHWYVADVKYSFHTRDAIEEGYSGPMSYANIYLVVKALTQEGAQIGTLNIPYWNQSIHGMDVVLLDSNGVSVPLDQAAILSNYREKGTVVLPRVTKGSVVAVHIRQGPFLVLDYWEYPMQGLVPTWRSAFQFSFPKRMQYAFKGYNGLAEPVADTRKRSETNLTWKAERILPLDALPYLDATGARPRLAITSRKSTAGQGYPDWKAVAAFRSKEHFSKGLTDRTRETRKLARQLTDGSRSDRDKAAVLLDWVQDNVGLDPEARSGMDLDRVLENRQGDLWQLSALLAELYASVGLESEILLTRDRTQGGLDSAMVTPSAAWEPVVVVRAEGREWAALPHARAYGLGDYPAELYGLQGLSLKTGSIRPLPEPAYPSAFVGVTQEVRLEAAKERTLTVELDGPWAGMARTDWYAGRYPDLAGFCRSFLESIGFQGSVLSCSEAGMEGRNRPLILELTVANAWTWAERDGVRQWSLPDLFSRPAWFYDSARVDGYHFPFAQTRRETVRFLAAPGMRLELRVPCREGSDSLLEVSC